MLITLDRKGTVEGLQYLLEQAAADEATSGALVVASVSYTHLGDRHVFPCKIRCVCFSCSAY